MTIQEIAKLINSKWVHQIRAGEKHRFVDITIVETEGRFFVRQYKFGMRSWYHAFLQNSTGAIKINDTIIPIDGVVPKDLKEINPKVNRAYFKKLNVLYPLMRLTYNRKKHEASTLELIPKIKM
ncbi:DUF2255 family protein [Marinifilum caeruleilacunae]|uniref:DUF2255 family protein n=1 Tax=Marinifilum caeruleilacunae TaxID=2499076 RepID=A0ABX1WQU3_9BACT|nr:DUF2255 family protein [Marinifilum caeruleilacunae]NOU58366.1 DUF2255 family protein [Marinifilum caeruleilacunae]